MVRLEYLDRDNQIHRTALMSKKQASDMRVKLYGAGISYIKTIPAGVR